MSMRRDVRLLAAPNQQPGLLFVPTLDSGHQESWVFCGGRESPVLGDPVVHFLLASIASVCVKGNTCGTLL